MKIRVGTSRRAPAARGIAVLVGLALLAAMPGPASAKQARQRFGGDQGNGRVYDPERMRNGRTSASLGRYMRRPDVPEPDALRSLRPTAVIPDPTPRMHGGSRYTRVGKYFYENATDPSLTRKSARQQYRNLVPSPEVVEVARKRSAATR